MFVKTNNRLENIDGSMVLLHQRYYKG